MKIVADSISLDELKNAAFSFMGDMVKAVVDIERELVAIDAELHSDLEAMLLQDGSNQRHLWGINLYPELPEGDFIEFDSMINIRPLQGNRSRGVDDSDLRARIIEILGRRILR